MANGFGGTLAAPIWHDYMSQASSGYCGDFPHADRPVRRHRLLRPLRDHRAAGRPGAVPRRHRAPGANPKSKTGGVGVSGTSAYNNPTLYAPPPQGSPQPGGTGNGGTGGNGGRTARQDRQLALAVAGATGRVDRLVDRAAGSLGAAGTTRCGHEPDETNDAQGREGRARRRGGGGSAQRHVPRQARQHGPRRCSVTWPARCAGSGSGSCLATVCASSSRPTIWTAPGSSIATAERPARRLVRELELIAALEQVLAAGAAPRVAALARR